MNSRIRKFHLQRRQCLALAVVGFILFLVSCLLWGLLGVLVGFLVMGALVGIAIMREWSSYDHLVCPNCEHHLLGERAEAFEREKAELLDAIAKGRLIRCGHCGAYIGTTIKISPKSVERLHTRDKQRQRQ